MSEFMDIITPTTLVQAEGSCNLAQGCRRIRAPYQASPLSLTVFCSSRLDDMWATPPYRPWLHLSPDYQVSLLRTKAPSFAL